MFVQYCERAALWIGENSEPSTGNVRGRAHQAAAQPERVIDSPVTVTDSEMDLPVRRQIIRPRRLRTSRDLQPRERMMFR